MTSFIIAERGGIAAIKNDVTMCSCWSPSPILVVVYCQVDSYNLASRAHDDVVYYCREEELPQ